MAGVAGLPYPSKINGCDSKSVKMHPTETAGNPRECRTMTDFTETRSMLKMLAMAEDGDTPIRQAAHNLLEMTENMSKSRDLRQQHQLTANINREMKRLRHLRISQPR